MKFNQVMLAIFVLSIMACNQSEPTAEAPREIKKYTIEQFYKNTNVGAGYFSPDESKLLVHSNESGIYNLYEINITDGSKKQLTDSNEESFFAVDYVPGTDQILYSADKGGNEIDHIYLLNSDGTSQDLTPGENEKANFGGWTADKKSFFYLSNKRDPQFFDLYKMSIGSWESELLYQNNDGLDVTDISEDENFLGLSRTVTTSENQLFIYDRAKKETTEISQADAPGSYSGSGFSDDGTSFFYTSDVGKEFAYLVKYDIASGERETIFETDWDVMYSYLSENEKYRVIGINEDGKNTLVIKDIESGKNVDFPQIPDGDVLGVSISDSEKLMRLAVGTSRAPSNRYVYNFESKEMKKTH